MVPVYHHLIPAFPLGAIPCGEYSGVPTETFSFERDRRRVVNGFWGALIEYGTVTLEWRAVNGGTGGYVLTPPDGDTLQLLPLVCRFLPDERAVSAGVWRMM